MYASICITVGLGSHLLHVNKAHAAFLFGAKDVVFFSGFIRFTSRSSVKVTSPLDRFGCYIKGYDTFSEALLIFCCCLCARYKLSVGSDSFLHGHRHGLKVRRTLA